MPIKVRCDCGKLYSVPDGTAGKHLKCKECGQVLTVPAGEASEGAGEAQGPSCPNCGTELTRQTTFCTGCGYNLETGTPRGEQDREPARKQPRRERPRRKRRAIALPWGKMIAAAAVVAALAAGWLFIVRPMGVQGDINDATDLAEEGKFKTAIEALQAIRADAYGKFAEEVEFRIKQVELERELGVAGQPSEAGKRIKIDARPELVEDSGKLLLNVTFENNGDEPIELRPRAFYLRDQGRLVYAASHTGEGALGAEVVAPGGTAEGVVAFWKLPGSYMGMIGPNMMKAQVLIYNDGARYRRILFTLAGAAGPDLPSGPAPQAP